MRGAGSGSDPFAGVLRIGVCPASLEWLLMKPLLTLVTRHPSVNIHITTSSYDRAVQQLRAGSVDVAFGYEAAFADQSDFRLDSLQALQTVFFVRRGHPLIDDRQVLKEDIARHSLSMPAGAAPTDYIWKEIYEKSGLEVGDKLHVVDHFPLVERLVRSTDAVSLVSVDYSRTEKFAKHFACVPFFEDLPSSPLCCATRLRWSVRPAVRAFIKSCREKLPLAPG